MFSRARDEGYNFAGWSGDITSQETSITITITKNKLSQPNSRLNNAL
jgi:uncharacterized repeat protein (TIGR02543 family)